MGKKWVTGQVVDGPMAHVAMMPGFRPTDPESHSDEEAEALSDLKTELKTGFKYV